MSLTTDAAARECGFVVLGGFDDVAAEGLPLTDAVNTARLEAVRNYRAMRKAA